MSKELRFKMAHAELVCHVLELQKVHSTFFHAICAQSCKYSESYGIKMTCCDWSILIDDFDRVKEKFIEIAKEINQIIYVCEDEG